MDRPPLSSQILWQELDRNWSHWIWICAPARTTRVTGGGLASRATRPGPASAFCFGQAAFEFKQKSVKGSPLRAPLALLYWPWGRFPVLYQGRARTVPTPTPLCGPLSPIGLELCARGGFCSGKTLVRGLCWVRRLLFHLEPEAGGRKPPAARGAASQPDASLWESRSNLPILSVSVLLAASLSESHRDLPGPRGCRSRLLSLG